MQDLERRIEADNSDIGRLLRAIFLPKRYGNNLRFASEGAGIQTATGNFSQTLEVFDDWSTATQTQQIPASDMMAFQFANPLRAFVYFVHNFAGAPYLYAALNDLGPAFPANNLTQVVQTRFVGATSTLPFAPHGAYLTAGHDEAGNTFLWVDNSPLAGSTATMRITFSVAPTVVTTQLQWWVWNGKNAILWATANTAVAQASYDCPGGAPSGGAYMFVKVCNVNDPALTTFTISVLGNRGCWAHRAIPQMEEFIVASPEFRVSGIRVNAAAFRAQNSSQEIEKNGNLVSVTVARCIPWSQIAAGTAQLSQLQNYRERANAKGYYGVLLPDSDEDISDFFDDIVPSTNDTESPIPSYPLVERRPYKALGITAPIPGGRNFVFDVTHAIEYVTNWKIQSVDTPRASEESLKGAIVIASTMETDYENPTHWSTILESIGKYGERIVAAQTEGPVSNVLDAISKFRPEFAAARFIGKNVVLPAQKMLFKEMQSYAQSKRPAKKGRWMGRPGGQMEYVEM